LQVSHVEEPALVGSAILAYTALGVYPDVVQATKAMVRTGRQYLPQQDAVEGYAKRYRFFRRLMRDLAGAFADHTSM
ncbi:MAG: gluconokinase, partial [Armatimonadota bacterium]